MQSDRLRQETAACLAAVSLPEDAPPELPSPAEDLPLGLPEAALLTPSRTCPRYRTQKAFSLCPGQMQEQMVRWHYRLP